ncbi:MAG: hypothetical protein GF364_10480 [Candidatus Lokiarchaeota archaeon]|nr:hypothetical protein [Candidatus Lokiarchaeota archaeon]
MTLNKKYLYKVWKNAGMGMDGVNALRREVMRTEQKSRGMFQTPESAVNLVPLFTRYRDYAEPTADSVKLWMVLIGAMWVFYIVFRALPSYDADLISGSALLELFIIDSAILSIEGIILQIKLKRNCDLENPGTIPDEKKSSCGIHVQGLIILIIMMAISRIILESETGIGIF